MPSTKVTATKLSKATKASTKVTAKPKSTATKTVTAATTAAAPAPPTSAAPAPAPTTSAVTERIQSLQATVVTLSTQLRSLSKELTAIQKEYTKDKRQWERQAAAAQKKRKPNGSTTVSGIAKPGYISPELCKFIGKDVGTEMARTEVIKHVNAYIKDHGLQDAKNKRIIRPDSKLQSLLKTKKSDEVTYFNLQTYMKRHYANPAKAVLNA
jgi:chromatin remodeling complex protein RSC6